jgi:hypothetical protein
MAATSWRLVAAASRWGSTGPGEDLDDGGVLDIGAEDAFACGVDQGERATDPVGDPGDLTGQIVGESDR